MKAAVDAGAAVAAVGALAQILPPMAALLAIIWYAIQIWQSEVGKNWRGRWWRLLVERSRLSFADEVCFVTLALMGSGIAIALWALTRIAR